MSDDGWDGGWSDSDDSSEPKEDGCLQKMGRWLTGKPETREDAGDDSLEAEIEAAEQRVAEYKASNKADEHRQRLWDPSYRSSIEYTLAVETEHLERHLAHYDEECARFGSEAMLSQELWAQRVAALNQALSKAERAAVQNEQSYDTLEDRWQRGDISRAEYDDLHRKLGRKEQRAGTRLGLGGLGGSYEEIGDVGDQSGHILVDSLLDDDGAMRQKIAKKIRSMPRRMALEIIQQAVADGVISQRAADYLVRECVRPS